MTRNVIGVREGYANAPDSMHANSESLSNEIDENELHDEQRM
jgi:hypothetical protein